MICKLHDQTSLLFAPDKIQLFHVVYLGYIVANSLIIPHQFQVSVYPSPHKDNVKFFSTALRQCQLALAFLGNSQCNTVTPFCVS